MQPCMGRLTLSLCDFREHIQCSHVSAPARDALCVRIYPRLMIHGSAGKTKLPPGLPASLPRVLVHLLVSGTVSLYNSYYMLFSCLILLLLSWICCLYCGSGAAAQGVKGAVTPSTMKHTGPSPQHDTHFYFIRNLGMFGAVDVKHGCICR